MNDRNKKQPAVDTRTGQLCFGFHTPADTVVDVSLSAVCMRPRQKIDDGQFYEVVADWAKLTNGCRCLVCGQSPPAEFAGRLMREWLVMMHRICHANGGRTTNQNLLPGCVDCNRLIGAIDIDVIVIQDEATGQVLDTIVQLLHPPKTRREKFVARFLKALHETKRSFMAADADRAVSVEPPAAEVTRPADVTPPSVMVDRRAQRRAEYETSFRRSEVLRTTDWYQKRTLNRLALELRTREAAPCLVDDERRIMPAAIMRDMAMHLMNDALMEQLDCMARDYVERAPYLTDDYREMIFEFLWATASKLAYQPTMDVLRNRPELGLVDHLGYMFSDYVRDVLREKQQQRANASA